MSYLKADLLADVVSSYDQTKTTIQGRVFSKTIDGDLTLGPPLSKFIDVFTDSGITPANLHVTQNGRIFVLPTPVNGAQYDTLLIGMYEFDVALGTYVYVGRINVDLPNLAATVHTVRSVKVIDTGTTGWKIFIATTATVAINGGLFLVNNVDRADFQIVVPTPITMATSTNAKAVYFLQDPSNVGTGQLNIAAAGSILDAANSRIYVKNGVSATYQYYVYNTAAAPTWLSNAVTIDDTTDVIADAGHSYGVNAPIIVTSLVGGTGLTNNTVYFVRNPVAGVSYQLSLTSGGAVINITTAGTAVIGRAWGTVTSNWVHKTGNLPALTGTLLNNDSEERAIPIAAPINGGLLNGNNCAFFATSSNLYLGLLSELTSGAVTWPSLTTSNILGSVNQITAPTVAVASWSNVLDAATYITNTSKFITKKVENNIIVSNTGELNNEYYETFNPPTVNLGLVTAIAMDFESGWLFTASNTVGQRGIIAVDFRSDSFYDYSYIVTKVLDNPNSLLKFSTTYEKYFDQTGNTKLQYRTSGFGSISGGWTDIPLGEDLSGLASGNSIQFKILFNIQSEGSSTPSQLNELLIGVESNVGISNNWEFSDDWSDNTSPSRCAFRLKATYAGAVPTLYFRAYDLSDSLLVNHDTVTNAANFEYSTDNGTIWLPLGTIPNTVGTLLRYTFTSPPGVDIRPGLKES